jgi:hypothetical protein
MARSQDEQYLINMIGQGFAGSDHLTFFWLSAARHSGALSPTGLKRDAEMHDSLSNIGKMAPQRRHAFVVSYQTRGRLDAFRSSRPLCRRVMHEVIRLFSELGVIPRSDCVER